MASTLQSFAVYAPDYADEDAINRRMKVREEHLIGVKELKETNSLRMLTVYWEGLLPKCG